MFMTPQSIQAETAYRQERIKRDFRGDFRGGTRRKRREQAANREPRHARRSLRPTHAA